MIGFRGHFQSNVITVQYREITAKKHNGSYPIISYKIKLRKKKIDTACMCIESECLLFNYTYITIGAQQKIGRRKELTIADDQQLPVPIPANGGSAVASRCMHT